MAKAGIGRRRLVQRDQIGLHPHLAADGRTQEVVKVAFLRAASFDAFAFALCHIKAVAVVLEGREQAGDRDVEGARQGEDRRKRCGDLAVLDLGQHAQGDVGGRGEISHGQVPHPPERAYLKADGVLQRTVRFDGRRARARRKVIDCGHRRPRARRGWPADALLDRQDNLGVRKRGSGHRARITAIPALVTL